MRTETEARSNWAAVVVVSLGVVLVALDLTIVAVALPTIGDALDAPPWTAQWVLLGYSLPLVALSLPAGRWLDRAGPRPAFQLAVAGFGVASTLIAVAPSAEVLIAGRVLQGVFGALLSVIGLPLVADAVRPEHRARALSVVLTLIPLSGVAGPAVGGLLTEAVGWRSIFLVNLPVAALALALSRRTIPAVASGRAGLPRPDGVLVRDALVLGTGVTALVFALSLLGGQQHAVAPAVGLLLVAGAATLVWARRESTRPVLALLRRPRMAPALLVLLTTVAGVGALNFLVPYALAEAGATASGIGFTLLVLAAAMALASPPAGLLAERFGTRPVVFVGSLAVLAGAAWLVVGGDLVGALVLVGVGNGLIAGPNAAMVLDSAPAGATGAAGGLSSLVRTLGFTLGPALAATLYIGAGGGEPGLHSGAVGLVILAAVAVGASVAARAARPRPW